MTEKEYIERDAAYKACEAYFSGVCVYDVSASEVINDFEEVIDAVPTADVAPVKHGHWESNEYLAGIHMTRCSECKTEFYIQDLEEISGDGFINFCPNCGARMDGSEAEKALKESEDNV